MCPGSNCGNEVGGQGNTWIPSNSFLQKQILKISVCVYILYFKQYAKSMSKAQYLEASWFTWMTTLAHMHSHIHKAITLWLTFSTKDSFGTQFHILPANKTLKGPGWNIWNKHSVCVTEILTSVETIEMSMTVQLEKGTREMGLWI